MFETTINGTVYNLNDLIKNKHNSTNGTHETVLLRCFRNDQPNNYQCIKCAKISSFKTHVRTTYSSRRDDDIITFHLYKNCKTCRKAPKNTIILQTPEITDFMIKYVWQALPNIEYNLMRDAIISNLTGRTILNAFSTQFPSLAYSNPSMFRLCVADAFDQLMRNTTAEQKLAIYDYVRTHSGSLSPATP
jgi:hypothetical protein